jgi:hypothetical protein
MESDFLRGDFDVEVHARRLVESGTDITAYLAEVADLDATVDARIRLQVETHYEDLLSQATQSEHLDVHLEMLQRHAASLQAAMDRLGSKIGDPYTKLRTATLTLSRLQQAADLVRRVQSKKRSFT